MLSNVSEIEIQKVLCSVALKSFSDSLTMMSTLQMEFIVERTKRIQLFGKLSDWGKHSQCCDYTFPGQSKHLSRHFGLPTLVAVPVLFFVVSSNLSFGYFALMACNALVSHCGGYRACES